MPWEVQKRSGKFCVVKIADGNVVACHATSEQAQAQVRALYASEANASLDALIDFARERDVNVPVGPGHQLRDYWVHGEGAAKIRWGTEGDGTRCIKHMRKYVRDPGGLCQEYHRMATGKSMHPHPGRLTESADLDEFGRFNPADHPHSPDNGRFIPTHGGGSIPAIAEYIQKTQPRITDLGGGRRRFHNMIGGGTSFESKHELSPNGKFLRIPNAGAMPLHVSNSTQAIAWAGWFSKHFYDKPDAWHALDDETRKIIQQYADHIKTTKMPRLQIKKFDGIEALSMETFADAPGEPYGDVKYADPGYRGRKRYPIDTEKHIRAAWAYINMPKNAAKYSADQLRSIKAKIKKAMTGTVGAEIATAAAKMKDCPPGQHMMDDGSCMSDADMKAYAIANGDDESTAQDEPWEGPLVVEGVESGDGRMFSQGSLDWADLPQPLMYQPANVGGHNGSIMVGEIQHMRRKGDQIHGRGRIFGHILAGEHGADVVQMVRTGGVSVDVDSVKDADVEMIYAADDKDGFMSKPETTIYHRGRIRGATLVAFPAFVEAKLQLTNDQLTASVDCDCERQLVAPLVAAAHTITIPDLPPKSWFDEPTDVELSGALTITDEGRVYGILAPANTTHRNRPTTVPLRNVDYSRFHKAETIVDDGSRVVTGVITADCGHAPTENYGSLQARMDHYDNSCSVLANVRVGESQKGYVWFAGALNAGAQPHQVAQALGCALSGDWQAHPDRTGVREFIAAHLVPVPGFPLARARASITTEDGVVTASWLPVRHEPTRELAAVNEAKLNIARRFGLDPDSRKTKIYAKARKMRATCALADAADPR